MSRRAKIVATLGPATSGPGRVTALVAAGLDVARLNMSHGDHDAHWAAYDAVRAAGHASGRGVGVLVDLQGPKIRLGRFAAGPVTLVPGQEFTITGEAVPGDQRGVSVSYPGLAGDVRPGTRLLVDDGRVVLEVTAVQGPRVRTRVVVGGQVSDHKGLNLPGVRVSVPALTSKDAEDLRWALGRTCAGCGTSHQRDDNAAINLARYEPLTTSDSALGPVRAAVKRGADRKTRPRRAGGDETRKGPSQQAEKQPRDGVPMSDSL
jgi:pyruvate kinase